MKKQRFLSIIKSFLCCFFLLQPFNAVSMNRLSCEDSEDNNDEDVNSEEFFKAFENEVFLPFLGKSNPLTFKATLDASLELFAHDDLEKQFSIVEKYIEKAFIQDPELANNLFYYLEEKYKEDYYQQRLNDFSNQLIPTLCDEKIPIKFIEKMSKQIQTYSSSKQK